jgi:tRNA pseudouridine13 synthase
MPTVKIKVRPEDFVVQEQADVTLDPQPGPYAIFELSKRQWDSFDLVAYLAKRLGVQRGDIALAGIKDRFADTSQLVSVRLSGRSPARLPRQLEDQGFLLRLRGYARAALGARDLSGNRFRIVVRDVDPRASGRFRQAAEAAGISGLPNYYDEQRFGSARHGQGFMGKEVFLGRREQALRLYFTPSRFDDRRTRELKRCVSERWGRWSECLPSAFGDYRPVLECLAQHRQAFRQALLRLDRRLLVFVLNAYQSYLFNEILGRWLTAQAGQRGFRLLTRSYRHGRFLYPDGLPADLAGVLAAQRLPVPGFDSEVPDPAVRAIAEAVLEAEGIGWSELRVRQLSGVSVHGVERAALVLPRELRVGEPAEDELYPGRHRLELEFFLPRGSYATLLLKRMEAIPLAGEASAEAAGEAAGSN